MSAVVYSAGLLGVGALSQMPIARLEQVMHVNAIAAVRLVQACLPGPWPDWATSRQIRAHVSRHCDGSSASTQSLET